MGNLRPKRQIVLLTLFTFLFSVVFPLGFAGNNVTHAASVLPDYYSGNDPEIGGFEEFKIDSGDLYDGVHGDGTLNVSVTFAVYNGEELSVDWSSNRPVYHVFVKGGPGGNLYSYGQGATEDWGLTAPINDNNDQVYAISHVTFYYTEEIEEVIEPLQLTSVCSDQRGKARFRIYNPNSFDLDFSYENVDNDNVGGTGTALAGDYTFFYVDAADNTANTTKLYWEGGSTVKASSNQYCKYEVTVIKAWQNSSNEVIDPPDNWAVTVEENGNTHNLGPANVSANFWLEFDQTFTVSETIEGYSTTGTGTFDREDVFSDGPSGQFKGQDVYQGGIHVVTNTKDDPPGNPGEDPDEEDPDKDDPEDNPDEENPESPGGGTSTGGRSDDNRAQTQVIVVEEPMVATPPAAPETMPEEIIIPEEPQVAAPDLPFTGGNAIAFLTGGVALAGLGFLVRRKFGRG